LDDGYIGICFMVIHHIGQSYMYLPYFTIEKKGQFGSKLPAFKKFLAFTHGCVCRHREDNSLVKMNFSYFPSNLSNALPAKVAS
jgi:hypothetical protein